jgi:VanZ family protein
MGGSSVDPHTMKPNHKLSGGTSPQGPDNLVNKWLAPLALYGGLGIILYATLKEFDFRFRSMGVTGYLRGFELLPSSFYDFPRNVLLFIPFGFGLAAFLHQRKWSPKATFFSVLISSFFLTLLVESLQFFLPGRTPNVSDLLANSLGGLAGLGCFRLWERRTAVSRRVKTTLLVPRNAIIIGLTYMLLLLILGAYLQSRTRLAGWNPYFTLSIGNEHTGNRPWSGTVTQLAILDKALSADEAAQLMAGNEITAVAGSALVAYYPLANTTILTDQAGNLPAFEWQGSTGLMAADEGLSLNGLHWLETEQPVSYLAERLQASSQLSIMLTLAADSFQQTGPARILTFSINSALRNFTLGQEGGDLIMRIRTPMTGENGVTPELAISDFFESANSQILIVSFDGLAVQTYIKDGQRAGRVEIVPGITFWRTLMNANDSPVVVDSAAGWIWMFVFYALFFIPLGILGAFLLAGATAPAPRRFFLIAGLSLPAILLEIVLSMRNGFEPRLLNILLGMFIMGMMLFLLATVTRQASGG